MSDGDYIAPRPAGTKVVPVSEMRCDICKWWLHTRDNIGGCLRFPPTHTGIIETYNAHYCGEFTRKGEA